MYIPEFVCGVAATLIVEVIASVVWVIRNDKNKKK